MVKSGRSGSETQRTADLAIAVRFSAFDKTQRNSHFSYFASRNDADSASITFGKYQGFCNEITPKLSSTTKATRYFSGEVIGICYRIKSVIIMVLQV